MNLTTKARRDAQRPRCGFRWVTRVVEPDHPKHRCVVALGHAKRSHRCKCGALTINPPTRPRSRVRGSSLPEPTIPASVLSRLELAYAAVSNYPRTRVVVVMSSDGSGTVRVELERVEGLVISALAALAAPVAKP